MIFVLIALLLGLFGVWLFTEAYMPNAAPPPLSPEDREARYEEWR